MICGKSVRQAGDGHGEAPGRVATVTGSRQGRRLCCQGVHEVEDRDCGDRGVEAGCVKAVLRGQGHNISPGPRLVNRTFARTDEVPLRLTEELELVLNASSPGRARRFDEALLIGWGLAAVVDEAVLLTSEVVTSAVIHGSLGRSPTSVVSVAADVDGVTISVTDPMPSPPVLRSPSAVAEVGGRGMRIVEHLAAEWGVRNTRHGKVVWFCLSTRNPIRMK